MAGLHFPSIKEQLATAAGRRRHRSQPAMLDTARFLVELGDLKQSEVPAELQAVRQHDLPGTRSRSDRTRRARERALMASIASRCRAGIFRWSALPRCWSSSPRGSSRLELQLVDPLFLPGPIEVLTTAEQLMSEGYRQVSLWDAHPGEPRPRAVCVLHRGDHRHSDRSDDGPIADLQRHSRSVRAVSAAAAEARADSAGGRLVRHRRGFEICADLSVDVSDDRRQCCVRGDERSRRAYSSRAVARRKSGSSSFAT